MNFLGLLGRQKRPQVLSGQKAKEAPEVEENPLGPSLLRVPQATKTICAGNAFVHTLFTLVYGKSKDYHCWFKSPVRHIPCRAGGGFDASLTQSKMQPRKHMWLVMYGHSSSTCNLISTRWYAKGAPLCAFAGPKEGVKSGGGSYVPGFQKSGHPPTAKPPKPPNYGQLR